MRNHPRAAFLPIAIFPAVLPAIMLPVLASTHLPDAVKGLAMGIPIGLSLVGIAWMAKTRGSPGRTKRDER